MPSESDIRGLQHELEHRRIKREVDRALKRTEQLRQAVRDIEQLYLEKPPRRKPRA
jgi:hypothetical protein